MTRFDFTLVPDPDFTLVPDPAFEPAPAPEPAVHPHPPVISTAARVRELLYNTADTYARIEREAVVAFLRSHRAATLTASEAADAIEQERHDPERAYNAAAWFGWEQDEEKPSNNDTEKKP